MSHSTNTLKNWAILQIASCNQRIPVVAPPRSPPFLPIYMGNPPFCLFELVRTQVSSVGAQQQAQQQLSAAGYSSRGGEGDHVRGTRGRRGGSTTMEEIPVAMSNGTADTAAADAGLNDCDEFQHSLQVFIVNFGHLRGMSLPKYSSKSCLRHGLANGRKKSASHQQSVSDALFSLLGALPSYTPNEVDDSFFNFLD